MVKNKAYWNKQLILEILRLCEFSSLKDLCRISSFRNNSFSEKEGRTAIRELRNEGFFIEGLPFQGYALSRFPDSLAEGLVRAKLPEDYRYHELRYDELILFDSVNEADTYLSQHVADLPDYASMLVSPESNINFSLKENCKKLHTMPVHLSILCKKQILNEESFIHAVMMKVETLAIEQMRNASTSEIQAFHPTYRNNEIHINDCLIGRIAFKSETDFGILHISLLLNQFSDEIHICRSTLAANLIASMNEFLVQYI